MPRLRDPKRNKDGTFGIGNTAAPSPGKSPGGPPKSERLDERVRYRLETPLDEQVNVSFTPADRYARKLLRSLDATDEGPSFVKTLKEAKELAYGTKTEADISATMFAAIERRIVKPS